MNRYLKIGAILIASFVLVVALAIWSLRPKIDRATLEDIETLLNHYSQALAGGEHIESDLYNEAMQALIQDRRRFYTDYLEIGVKSNLEAISSDFDFVPRTDIPSLAYVEAFAMANDTSTRWDMLRGRAVIVQSGAQVRALGNGAYAIRATEMLTLSAKYSVPPEEHPTVLGLQWALERTDDPRVRKELEAHMQSHLESSRSSYEEGYDIVLILYHHLRVQRTPTALQIIEDTYTDQDAIFPGIDHVMWVDGQFVRDDESGITDTAEYLIYQRSVEEIGQGFLQFYGGEAACLECAPNETSEELQPSPAEPLIPQERLVEGTVLSVKENNIVISSTKRGLVTLHILPKTRIWKGKWDNTLPIEVGDFFYGYGDPNEDGTVFEMEQLEINIVNLRGGVAKVTNVAEGVDIEMIESRSGQTEIIHINTATMISTGDGEYPFGEKFVEFRADDGIQIIGARLKDGSIQATTCWHTASNR